MASSRDLTRETRAQHFRANGIEADGVRPCANLSHLGIDAAWPEETVAGLRQRLGLHASGEGSLRR